MTDHHVSLFYFDGHLGHLAPIIPPFGSMALQKYRESHHVCVSVVIQRDNEMYRHTNFRI
jgi:hypothetical protein